MSEKYCSQCKQWLSYSAFGKNRSTKDGYQYWCKLCKNTYQQENITPEQRQKYRQNSPTPTEYYRQWRKQRGKKYLEYRKQYRKSNPEKTKYRNTNFREHHPKYAAQYRKNNPEKHQQYRQNYKARKLNTPGEFTDKQFERVKQLFNYCCARCGKHESECGILTIDHVLPLSPRTGTPQGQNDIINIQPLCKSCNSTKSNRHEDYRKRGFFKKLFEQLDLF